MDKSVGESGTFSWYCAPKPLWSPVCTSKLKKNCPKCQLCGKKLIRWGKLRSGTQRWRCSFCRRSLVLGKETRERRYFNLFRIWVLGSVSIENLLKLSGERICSKTLLRHFDTFLDCPPKPERLPDTKEIYLKCDGKYFGHWGCVLVYKERNNIIFWSFVERETFFNYRNDLISLASLGFIVKGVTSDWHGSIVAAAKSLWRDIPHQRCLVHTQRFCQSLLTKHPETEAGKNLLELICLLNKIETPYEKDIWLKWLERFEERYGDIIKERTYETNGDKHWWYTHKNLRRAFMTLKATRDSLFLYLDYPDLPKDTNGLEAEFSHLKQKLGAHRGMKRSRKINFIRWYFYLKSIYSEYKN